MADVQSVELWIKFIKLKIDLKNNKIAAAWVKTFFITHISGKKSNFFCPY